MSNEGDRAGMEYWDRFWKESEAFPASISPYSSLHSFIHKKYMEFYKERFSKFDTKNMKLLEIGCARSVWLPHFAKEYSFEIYGIDYSEEGCRQAREIMKKEGVRGTIVHADMFNPPEYMKGFFDVVISLGVIEHFNNTVEAVRAHSDFLKPGGIMLSKIPNLNGPAGFLLRAINSDFHMTHVVLGPDELSGACAECDLKVNECSYLPLLELDFSWGKLNIGKSSLLSPFINCVGEKTKRLQPDCCPGY